MERALEETRKRITARVSDSVRDTLEQAAELLGATVNQFVVQTAYVEAQSDYFVSNGGSIASVWAASDTLALSLAVSKENHDYIDSSPSAVTFVSRFDRVTTGQARLAYSPTAYLNFKLTFRYNKAESNQAQFQYNDGVAAASVTYMIRP